jgi:hypothetical protein
LLPWNPETDEPPAEIAPVAWFLHQASLAIGRDNAADALRWVHRALRHDPDLREAGSHAETVRQALPELERKARLMALALAVRFTPRQPALPSDVLAGALEVFSTQPQGQAIVAAASAGDLAAAQQDLIALARQNDLSPALAHHLALFFYRAAQYCEDEADGKTADAYWRLAWPCWLRFLQPGDSPKTGQTPELPANQRFFLTRLFDKHHHFIRDYLSWNAIEDARRHWLLVENVQATVETYAPILAAEVMDCVARFREKLAADYLTATREVLKHGVAAVGWRANYEQGLQYLRRLLSLDPDNLRLLTALVDICGDWFLDCYNNEDPRTLWEQVPRFHPFAVKLARLVDHQPQEWSARAAVAEFYKFRGLMAPHRAEKIAVYREALRFNPDDINLRELLASLGENQKSS